jgi:hypothetical protein
MGWSRSASASSSGTRGRSGLPKQDSRTGRHPASPRGPRTKGLRASKIALQPTCNTPLQVTPALTLELAALLGRILANDVLQLPELPGADATPTTNPDRGASARLNGGACDQPDYDASLLRVRH